MKFDISINTKILHSILLLLLLTLSANAQNQFVAPENMPENPGPELGEVIGEIAEKELPGAVDYHQLAELTLQLGQAAMQQGQRIPDPSIWDGIHAVDAGESLVPNQTDWATLRSELEKLLEKPPEQPQDQQNEQNDQQQNQENSESQDSEGDSGDSESNQDQQSQEQNGEQQEQEEGGEDSKTEEDPSGDQEQQSSPQEEGDGEQNQQPQTNQTLGDMDDSQRPELDQSQSPQEEEQTQVGGTQQEQPIRSAKQAMTMQQLEQLKQQDKPGALHMLLQQAEKQEQSAKANKNLKDW